MKVLHIYKSGPYSSNGGVEKFICCLAKHSKSLGVKTSILSIADDETVTLKRTKDFIEIQCPTQFEFASTKFSFHTIFVLKKIIRNYDIVHLHYPDPFASLVYLLTVMGRVPSIMTYHSDIVSQKFLGKLYLPIRNILVHKVKKICFTSTAYAETSQLRVAVHNKACVIPIGLEEPPKLSSISSKIDFWRVELPKDFVLFIGQFRNYKGLDIAFDAIKESGQNLILIGNGKLANHLEKRKINEKISNVIFVGEVSESDKYAILSLCRVVILPSNTRAEAFGITLLEAASYAKPTISCFLETGTSFINKHMETGLEVRPGSVAELRNAISILCKNVVFADKLGASARIRYEELFRAEVMAEKYVRLYKNILGS